MKIIFAVFLLSTLNAYSQKDTACSCRGYIELDRNQSVKIMTAPNGTLIKVIKYDARSEDFLKVDIDKVSGSYFHAKLQYDASGKSFAGWFIKNNYLLTLVKNYSSSVKLYSSPATSSKVASTIAVDSDDLFVIQNCKGNWLLVKPKSVKSVVKVGWLQGKDACPNPLTTCN